MNAPYIGRHSSDWIEKNAITHMEKEYLIHERIYVYTLFEGLDINWHWDMEKIHKFDQYWKYGLSIPRIAELLGVHELEAYLMVLDRGTKNKIKPREGGLNGIWDS